MAGQKQDDQLEHTYSSYVWKQDVDLKTYQKRLTIGRSGARGSGISMPVARHDDDDDSNMSDKLCLIQLSTHEIKASVTSSFKFDQHFLDNSIIFAVV